MKLELLKRLYMTHSPSHKEEKMIALVESELKRMKIPYDKDELGQLYAINPGTPLLVHHMDQVQKKKCHKVMAIKNRIYGFTKKGKLSGLGADDKNGIFIALNMIEKFREEISFIFSVAEEVGGDLRKLTPHLNLADTPYALIFDRKGKGDIIGASNNYCCDDLEVAIEVIGREFKYKPAMGIFSDADELSKWVPCVNLSCGYYNAHTEEEFTKPSELWNAMKLAEHLITNLPKKGAPYELPEKLTPATSWYTYDEEHWSVNYDWDENGYPMPKSTTSTGNTSLSTKTRKALSKDEVIAVQDGSSLTIDKDEVVFFDVNLVEHWMADTVGSAVGDWILDDGKKLKITETKKGEVFCFYEGIQIDVELFDDDGRYETMSGPSKKQHNKVPV